MSLQVTKRIDINKYKAVFAAANLEALKTLLPDEVAYMKAQTLAGKNIDGGAFKPYSPRYGAYKRKKLGTDKVNLTETGQMIGSITYEVQQKGSGCIGRIFFNSEKQKEKARWNIEDHGRPFFGLGTKRQQGFLNRLKRFHKQYVLDRVK